MRGEATRQANMMLAITPDQLVPADHPIRAIKAIVDTALAELSPLFNEIYARTGRPSIPPEHLLKGRLLMELFSVPGSHREPASGKDLNQQRARGSISQTLRCNPAFSAPC